MSVVEDYLTTYGTVGREPSAAARSSTMTPADFEELVKLHLFWALKQVESLGDYGCNWDGYNAAPPDSEVAAGAAHMLAVLKAIWMVSEPIVNPTRNGGVSMEWEKGRHYLEIDVDSRDTATFLYKDTVDNVRRSGKIDAYKPPHPDLLFAMKCMF